MSNSIQALGWTLIHFCWQAAAVAVAYRLMDAVFSRSRSHVRYLLALSAVMSLLIVATATFVYEQKRIVVESVSYSLVAVDGRTIYAQPDRDTIVSSNISTTGGNPFDRIQQLVGDLGDAARRILPGDVLSWVDAIWLAGVMTLSVRLFGGWMAVRRLQASTKAPAPQAVYAAFLRLAGSMGVTRRVDLLICQRIAGPVAIGILRSVIILPAAALSHLSPEQLEVVIAHELAHIRRADYLWNMLQTMMETLFFFHPAVWWLGNRTRQLRELCCDDEAVAACGDPMVYATALLQLEEQRALRLRLAMAFHGSTGSLKSRILHILEGRQTINGIRRRDAIPLSLAGVAAMLGIFLLPIPHVIAGKAVVAEGKAAERKVQAPLQSASQPTPAEASSRTEPAESTKASTDKLAEPVSPVAPAVVPEISVPVSPSPIIAVHPHIELHAPVAPHLATSIAVHPVITLNTAGFAPIAPISFVALRPFSTQERTASESTQDKAYLQGMHDLGYTDIDKLIAMKVQGITVDYAQRMAKAGYGTPSADDLIALKTFGVTPEEAEKLHAEGGGRTSLKELVRYKIFRVTPEFAAEMKAAGFGELSPDKLVALRIQNVTPEFAKSMRQKFPQVTVDQLIQMKIFRIDDDFIATAKTHGFDSLSLEKLIRLRVSGVLDDNSVQR
ncbi:MAG TPA: M56 family metallopeptidase [Edaphobacter sp.]